jgi:dnd system-associated protein 4
MPRRVRRPKDKEGLFKLLTEGEMAIFNSYKDVFMTAASIGFKYGKKEPFDQTSEAIAWTIFSGQTDLPIINAIALNETEDVNILLNDDETFDRKFNIVEEYANGGLQILQERVVDVPGNALDNLINLINHEKKTNQQKSIGLEQFGDSLFW